MTKEKDNCQEFEKVELLMWMFSNLDLDTIKGLKIMSQYMSERDVSPQAAKQPLLND